MINVKTTGLLIWIALSASGFTALNYFSQSPGTHGSTPAIWPPQSQIQLALDQPTLIFFAHPKCSCTRASLNELISLISKSKNPFVTKIVFYEPPESNEGWHQTNLWKTANSIPNVDVIMDFSGREAQLFDVKTSGHTVFYSQTGHLLFSGGITASRGHEGDNVGKSSLLELLKGNFQSTRFTQTFGCNLFNDEAVKRNPSENTVH